MTPFAPLAVLALLATPAAADIAMRFDEGAPKDRFTATNTGACAIGPLKLTIDLSGSSAGLIFDVTGQGAGVEVFQPFELVAGGDLLDQTPQVADGDTQITLSLRALNAGQSVAFTIDLDDTIGQREITVSGSEIAGTSVRVITAETETTATFGSDAQTGVAVKDCIS